MATIKKACKGVSYPKSSSVSKRLGSPSKAKTGTSFGMLSVKAGIDDNPNPTQADRIAGAKMKAGKMKKGGKLLKKQAATAIAMKKAGKTPKAMMKKGGTMKKCAYGCK